MNAPSFFRTRSRTAAAFAALALLVPLTAFAALTAWTFDKTPHDAYYQFSNSSAFDAHRGVLLRGGVQVAAATWDYPGMMMGGSGEFHGLPAATPHTLRVFIRATAVSPWTLVKTQNFTTDP